MMGLAALMLLQQPFGCPDSEGAAILLDDRDRTAWNHNMIAEGLALIDTAMRHRLTSPISACISIA